MPRPSSDGRAELNESFSSVRSEAWFHSSVKEVLCLHVVSPFFIFLPVFGLPGMLNCPLPKRWLRAVFRGDTAWAGGLSDDLDLRPRAFLNQASGGDATYGEVSPELIEWLLAECPMHAEETAKKETQREHSNQSTRCF